MCCFGTHTKTHSLFFLCLRSKGPISCGSRDDYEASDTRGNAASSSSKVSAKSKAKSKAKPKARPVLRRMDKHIGNSSDDEAASQKQGTKRKAKCIDVEDEFQTHTTDASGETRLTYFIDDLCNAVNYTLERKPWLVTCHVTI